MSLKLDSLGNLSDLLKTPEEGVPLEIPIEKIDEDPNQPRRNFNQSALEELADSIKERGVKTPISIRPGSEDGRFIINYGARRYRASIIAQKNTIPAIIDVDFSLTDQLIENLQREDLAPLEIANAIAALKAEGRGWKGDIAKSIGKSNSYVTQHLALLKLPDVLAEALNTGKTQDVTLLYELSKDYNKYPQEVETFIAEGNISRSGWKEVKDFLDTEKGKGKTDKKSKAEYSDCGETGNEEQGDDQTIPERHAFDFEGDADIPDSGDTSIRDENTDHSTTQSYDHGDYSGDRNDGGSYAGDAGASSGSGGTMAHILPGKPDTMKKYVWQGVWKERVVELFFKLRPQSSTTIVCKYPAGTPDADNGYFEVEFKDIQGIGVLEDF